MGGDFIGSHLVELSTGYDFLKSVILVALNKFIPPKISNRHFAGVYFLCKETKHLLPYFYKNNEFDVEKEIKTPELKFISSSNDRSGFLIYKSNAITDKHYDKVIFFDDFTHESSILGHNIIGGTNAIEESYEKGLFNELLIGIVIEHRKLMGFHCYKVCWALTTVLGPVEGLEPEWFKQKELSLFQKAIKI